MVPSFFFRPLPVESTCRGSRPRQAKMLWGLVAFWVSLALAPFSAFSQGTVPVTVQVLFPCESNCGSPPPGVNAANILGDALMSQVVLLQRPCTLGGIFRYEHIHWQQRGWDLDVNSYATSLQLTWDRDRVSFGALLPYDFLDFERFQGHIVGLVPFVRYRLPLSTSSTVAFTANGNNAHTANTGRLGIGIPTAAVSVCPRPGMKISWSCEGGSHINDNYGSSLL